MDDQSRRRRPRRIAGKKTLRDHAVLAGLDPKALVMTDDGPVPFEWIAEGDKLLTRDAGYQPVIWTDRTNLDMKTIRSVPEFAPVQIAMDPRTGVGPDRPFVTSPSQLMFLTRTPEDTDGGGVLVPAETVFDPLDPSGLPDTETISFVSILLPMHHLIQVEGVWMGSLYTADLGLELPAGDAVKTKLAEEVMTPVCPILSTQDAIQFLATRARAQGKRSA